MASYLRLIALLGALLLCDSRNVDIAMELVCWSGVGAAARVWRWLFLVAWLVIFIAWAVAFDVFFVLGFVGAVRTGFARWKSTPSKQFSEVSRSEVAQHTRSVLGGMRDDYDTSRKRCVIYQEAVLAVYGFASWHK